MSTRHKIDALVFARRNWGEADRIVTFFTEELGLIRAIAKGVRKIPSHRGGHLEPFTKVHVLLQESRTGVFVQSVETLEYYESLREHSEALRHAGNMALIIHRLFDIHDPQAKLFSMIDYAWEKLPDMPEKRQALLEGAVVMEALRLAGMTPDLTRCMGCGINRPSEAIVLKAQDGSWQCLSCHGSLYGAEYSLSPRLLQALRFMTKSPLQSVRLAMTDDETTQLIAAIRRYIADVVETSAAPA